jgi:predicted GTPase
MLTSTNISGLWVRRGVGRVKYVFNRSKTRKASDQLEIFLKKIIDTLIGKPGRAVETYTSVTQGLEAIRILNHEQYGSRIVLVDTPGFDNSSKTDTEILKLIDEWLVKTYVELDPS